MASEEQNGVALDTELPKNSGPVTQPSQLQNDIPSDHETSEPVREQFKKASISKDGVDKSTASDETAKEKASTLAGGDTATDSELDGTTEDVESRGRLQQQKSTEHIEGDERPEENTTANPPQTRKRSRDSTAEEAELNDGQRKSLDRPRDAEDVEGELDQSSNGHPKLPPKARLGTPERGTEQSKEAVAEQMTSPKTKKTRLQATSGQSEEELSIKADGTTIPAEEAKSQAQVESKINPVPKIPATSGFANTSSASPFATFASPKPPSAEPQTSASAFASSGFSALSGATSAFGAVGKTSGGFGVGGGFATGSKTPLSNGATDSIFGKSTTSTSTVNQEPASGNPSNGISGQKSIFSEKPGSAFGSGSSGFAKVGEKSGFGSIFGGAGFGGFGGNGGLSSFASGKPSSSLSGGSKPVKAFGAAADEEEEVGEEEGENADDAGFKSPLSQETDKQDERFYKQDLETGEEDEYTEYSCRAKLYSFTDKEWKERGLGVVRLNVSKAALGEEEAAVPKARLLMRADGSHRVILNTPIKKEIKLGAPTGGAPLGGFVYFMGAVDGTSTLTLLQLKIRQQFAMELYDKVVELQEAM